MKENKNMKKTQIFIGHERGVAIDFEGNTYKNGWVDTAIELKDNEIIKAYRTSSDDTGEFGGLIINISDIKQLIARTLTLVDAMFTDKSQKDAFKKLLKREQYNWFNDIDARGPDIFNYCCIDTEVE